MSVDVLEEELPITDATGLQSQVKISLSDYREAGAHKVSLSQLYGAKYPTNKGQPTAFQQLCKQAGIRLKAIPELGLQASSMGEILNGDLPGKHLGSIIRPDGSARQGTAGRLLYPEVMLQLINSNLVENKDPYLVPWENAIALKSSVTSPRVDQPTIDTTAPESSAAQPISQGAEPAIMVSITLGERQYTIPTKSIGLSITDEALQATTIDLVGLTLAAQARGERIRRIEDDMANIISGDTDFNINAVTTANASTFDSDIPGTHFFTQKAWVKWLRANYLKMSITHILCDVDTALAIESRNGRPTVFNDTSTQPNLLDAYYTVENMGMPTPRLLILPSSIVGANTAIGFDASQAMHEITNVSASYQAIEEFVMRRTLAMRFDFGVALVKLYDDAFTGIVLGA